MPGFFAGFDHRNAQKALDFQALWQDAGCRAKQERQLRGQFLNVESPLWLVRASHDGNRNGKAQRG